ncbi:MAG: transporter substrate-binding domain-containing protein [Clostridiales bacterium]|nr:transporter substrate-binding domain-containing protein [Clostridiales bacterium]
MKKALALLLVMMMAMLALVGCGGGEANNGEKLEAKINIEEILGHKPTGRLAEILEKGELEFTTSPDYPPYEFVNPELSGDEQYVGADVELAKYIADQMGVKIKFEIMDFDGVLTNMTQGLSDLAVSGLSPKPDRQEAMDFTIEYDGSGEGYHGVMIPVSEKANYKEFADFKGKTIGVQNGSLQEELANIHLKDANIKPIVKLGDGVMMLNNGTIDGLVIASTTGDSYIKNYDNLCMSYVVLDSSNVGMAAAVPKGEDDLLAVVNYIIEDVLEQDLINTWVNEAKQLQDDLGLE